jgi:acetyltransferase-like isoleucine patch superfamily enzyme
MVRSYFLTIIGIFPASRMKNFVLRRLGFDVARAAILSSNLFLGVSNLSLGQGAVIRRFNVFRDVKIIIHNNTIIGSWNWISSAPALSSHRNFMGELVLGNGSAINSRNYFDCSGGIYFGPLSDLAGVRSTFITHYIDTKVSGQTCEPIIIGEAVMLSSNLKLTPGVKIGNKALIGMGSVLTGKEYPGGFLIAGVPGKVIREVTGTWFERVTGHTGVREDDE